MPRGQKTSSFFVCAATFILLEVAALALLHATSTLQNIWITRTSHRTMAFLWGSGETIRSQFQLDRLNRDLQAENARLQERLRAYERSEAGQAELEHMAVRESDGYRYTPATVVKMSRNRTRNYIILNKGSEDGIRPQSGIISDRGVVGVVEAVDKHYSYGLTLMNPEMSVGARPVPSCATCRRTTPWSRAIPSGPAAIRRFSRRASRSASPAVPGSSTVPHARLR